MSKTWYGHHIETIKGDDYVLFKDYLKLDKEIDRLNNIINELEKYAEEEIIEGNKRPEDYVKYGIEDYVKGQVVAFKHILDKLKELKEDNK